MNAAIHFTADAFEPTSGALHGRRMAGVSFLEAFARHAKVDRMFCYAESEELFHAFERQVAGHGNDKPTAWIRKSNPPGLAEPGCLFVFDSAIHRFAWHRRHHDQRGYSLCGITHAMSYQTRMDDIGGLLLGPVQSWDALICTSRAVKAAVTRVIEGWREYLARRTGASTRLDVRLPVIPLGVDCRALGPGLDDEARAAIRRRLGIAEDDVVVLYVGRLDHHTKSNPIAMYTALERAAGRSGKRIHLVIAGWFPTQPTVSAFQEAATRLCPSVPVHHVDLREPDPRRLAWLTADIFTSLSDNIQESFGLTPVEAMAAGLPAVVSDWNGYRDTVRHGVDGFAIPTYMPGHGPGTALALGHSLGLESYEQYVGAASQCVAVDVEGAANAFVELARDADLRRRMGEAGRRRALERFDWSVIIPRYQDLWAELGERRAAEEESAPSSLAWPADPLRADPFWAFAGHATASIAADWHVAIDGAVDLARLRAVLDLEIVSPGQAHFATGAESERLFGHLAEQGRTSVGDLLALFPISRRNGIVRAIARLAKSGLVRLEPPR